MAQPAIIEASSASAASQMAPPLHTVYALYETFDGQDDYRAFSYLMRIEETLPESISVLARILGRYRGPRLRKQIVKAKGQGRNSKSPHYRGIGRIRRQFLARFNFSPSYHWFSSIDANLYSSARWMRAWNQRDSRAIIFAHSLHRGLRLVELIFIFASQVPSGIVLVLLDTTELEPSDLATLRRWGVTVLLDGSEVGFAESEAVQALPAFEFDSLVEKPLLAKKCPPANWQDILVSSQLKDRNPEKVLFFRPDWMKCGSATTFAKLASIFRQRGSILIDVALQPHNIFCNRSDIADKLAEVEEAFAPAFHVNLRRASLPVCMFKLGFFTLLTRPRTMAGHMAVFYRQCTVPRALKQLLANAHIDYLYVNHYFTLPLAKSIRPDVPVFLDTHDIQSLNYISHDYHHRAKMRAASFTDCLQEELAIVDAAERVAMVSREEIELVKQYRPKSDYFYYVPLPNYVGDPASASPGRVTPPILQALIVASRNPANERSLAWFLKRIWPKASLLPYHLTIVGSIDRSFEDYSHPKVTFAGLVDDLQAAYGQADLIILPITNGGGIAIKALEALQAELPIVCTPHAMRGLPLRVQEALPCSLTEIDMINDLTNLACNREALLERKAQVRRAHQTLLSIDFDTQLNRELDAMRDLGRG